MQNKWMTREEFEKGRTRATLCWIAYDKITVINSIFSSGKYYRAASSELFDTKRIKAVMPILKPEYPKEVG